ncbi:Speckle-type POZ protein [Araneus ventricosus]|uniref:Speckle-type POZ protein n=1 Tax=Araneus ventricosus TaxID=182803 RepID=A0A4Y2D768_ARAVE|nr:Speckle-type POZ protein [Araneus ventricosus]
MSSQENELRMFKVTWRIENFSYATQKDGEALLSPTFVIDTSIKTEWHLELYPRGKMANGFISCFLKRAAYDNGPANVLISCKFSILDEYESEHFIFQINNVLADRENFFGVSQFASKDDILEHKRNAFLPHDTLTICFSMWNAGLSQSTQCEIRSLFGIEKRSFSWIIDKFGERRSNEGWSTPIPTTSNQPFFLRMTFAVSDESENEGKISIGVQNYVNWSIFVTCKVSVVDEDGNTGFLANDEHLFSGKETWILPAFTTRGKLLARRSLLLPNGDLTLRCEIALSDGIKINCIESSTYGSHSSETGHLNVSGICTIAEDHGSLKDDLYCLYVEKKLCDLNLKVGDAIFPVHKAILSARSSVFSSTFNVRGEAMSSEITIPEMDPEIISKMLVYIYSDTLEDLDWESALKLYSAADKYEILSLKRQISNYLVSRLTQENVSDILVLAESYRDAGLKAAAQEFIFVHDREIIPSPQWKRFVNSKHKLAAETMQYIYVKRMKLD